MANTSFNNPYKDISFVKASPFYDDISGATQSNPYHCNYDGYAFVVGATTGTVTLNIGTVYLSARIVNDSTNYHVFYIKKGLNIWFGSPVDVAPSHARFFPIN